MCKQTSIFLSIACSVFLIFFANSAFSHDDHSIRYVKPDDISKLSLAAMPGSESSRLSITPDWRCFIEPNTGLQSCKPVLIICLKDTNDCVEI